MSARWVRRIAVASVLLVGLVAAVISYNHIYELASRSGEAWRATLLPLSVDGMLVAATLAIVDRRRVNEPAGWVPWLGLILGIAASLAGNVAAARPDLISQIVAAWPPVALAVSIETLVVILRRVDSGTHALRESFTEEPADSDLPDDLLVQAKRVIATSDGMVGRNRLARELDVTPHRARVILEQISNNGHGAP